MAGRSLLIAFVVGLFSVILLVLQYQRFEVEVTGGERVAVLVAVKPIERDKVITDDMVSVREVPHVYVEDRAIRDRDRPKIVGLHIATSVGAQQTLMWTDLVTSSEEQRNLSGLVQQGSRAIAIRTSRQDSSVALIRPGDYVDVLATVTPKGGVAAGGDELKSIVLLQKVLVLAVGNITSPDLIEEKAADKNSARSTGDESLLTLSLTLPEAQLVALAADTGRVSVILRNIDDTNVIERPQDMTTPRVGERDAGPRGGPSRPHGPTALPH
jgi:pilus assembly protein CpaB